MKIEHSVETLNGGNHHLMATPFEWCVSRAVQRWWLLPAVALLTACSSFNPYQKSAELQADLAPLGSGGSAQQMAAGCNVKDVQHTKSVLKQELCDAQRAINAQREEWFDSLSAQSRVRVASSMSLIGLSSLALVSGLNATGDDVKRRLTWAGAAAAATYAGSDWWVNSAHERAYIKGYRLLTCQLGLSDALQAELSTFESLEGKTGHRGQLGDLDAALSELDRVLLPMTFARLHQLQQADGSGAKDKQELLADAAPLHEQEAQRAARLGRSTLENARLLTAQLKQAGPQLRRRGELIVAAIAQNIQATQKRTPDPEQLIAGSLKKVMKAFTDIEGSKGAAEEDAGSGAEGDKKTTEAPDGKKSLFSPFSLGIDQNAKGPGSSAREKENEAAALGHAVAAVYAARRPLANRLYAFAQARDPWVKSPECSAQDSLLRLSPEGPIEIAPGGVQEIQVINPSGLPRFRVSNGSVKSELVRSTSDGQWVVRVTVGQEAAGTFLLTVSDDQGGEEEVLFKISAAKK
ncbi:MAG: hypothetical protein MUE43_12045 [Serpentinimonas sp.]|jgi:hypothetical protein|nr:hypothetical protein [Serpentinimonas sp.]